MNPRMLKLDDFVNRERFADLSSKSRLSGSNSGRADGGGGLVASGVAAGCGCVMRWPGKFATALLTETAGIKREV